VRGWDFTRVLCLLRSLFTLWLLALERRQEQRHGVKIAQVLPKLEDTPCIKLLN
jgi:hypothetical protein